MESQISSWLDTSNQASVFQITITDADMALAMSNFTAQEEMSFRNLSDGTMAEKVLALAMLVYTLQQIKNDEHNLPRNQEISGTNADLQTQ